MPFNVKQPSLDRKVDHCGVREVPRHCFLYLSGISVLRTPFPGSSPALHKRCMLKTLVLQDSSSVLVRHSYRTKRPTRLQTQLAENLLIEKEQIPTWVNGTSHSLGTRSKHLQTRAPQLGLPQPGRVVLVHCSKGHIWFPKKSACLGLQRRRCTDQACAQRASPHEPPTGSGQGERPT